MSPLRYAFILWWEEYCWLLIKTLWLSIVLFFSLSLNLDDKVHTVCSVYQQRLAYVPYRDSNTSTGKDFKLKWGAWSGAYFFFNINLGLHRLVEIVVLVQIYYLLFSCVKVEYVFSDKTGTLTRNLMEFFKCSIGGQMYGTGITETEKGSAQRNGLRIEEVYIQGNSHNTTTVKCIF